jgi:hypothetical protein
MFWGNFCQTFSFNIEDLNIKDSEISKYDFIFYYRDSDTDRIIVQTDEDFEIF